MKKLATQIFHLKREFDKIYHPDTHQENLEQLLEIKHQIDAIELILENNYECDHCDGYGVIECECDCGHQHQTDCDDCDGDGLIEKDKEEAV